VRTAEQTPHKERECGSTFTKKHNPIYRESVFNETAFRGEKSRGDALPKTENRFFPAAGTASAAVVDPARRTTHPNMILAICCMSLLIVGMDVTSDLEYPPTVLALNAFSSFSGFLFLNVLYLQQVRGFSAFHTGLFTLPLAVTMIVSAPWSGWLVGSYGTRPPLLASGAGLLLSSLMLTGLSQQTSVGWLLAAYALFGVGLGMVNPAITNSAVAGMPLSQAGVAAAIASTSRQVGAAIGVAVSGSVVAVSHARGTDFTTATHAIWWVMTACGAAVLVLGFASNTAWARGSTEWVAHLFEESH